MHIDQRTMDWLSERYWVEDALLVEARDNFSKQGGPLIELPRESASVVSMLVRLSRPSNVLEIGTLFGYSTTWIARGLERAAHIDTLELKDKHADAAEILFSEAGVSDLITVHRGDAMSSLEKLKGPWDFVFVDADKAGYIRYVNYLLDSQKLSSGAVIVADNVASAGRVSDSDNNSNTAIAMRKYHEFLLTDKRIVTTVFPVGDGLAVSSVI